ncbi:response regulator [Umboniibacter marinipuniceus]|uniref:LuxR family two component transcriptional regulator n=1 Tax=Umboniibacter marinipuniceus TaxID=569599 RepID=A0A3M0A993_9GAMM|nr:response regulator transcription factor [Umboniibacter marinipuniceus]RMA81176.1 LuxR family two component transcriptional regulator [Umboniibacter marinipuniceus]
MKILIADDHELVRTGMAYMLRSFDFGGVVLAASSGVEALAQVQQHQPDVVLMDVNMPGLGGIEATRRIKRMAPATHVIMLSGSVDVLCIDAALAAGASGYISKSIGGEKLEEAIRSVMQGGSFLCDESQLLKDRYKSSKANYFEHLSARETQICLLIAEGIKVPDIAEQLALSPKTINTYRYRIFEKFCVNSDVELALAIHRQRSREASAVADV